MDVPLFDIVPWTHGYAHSWALRWMLIKNRAAREALLALFLSDGGGPWNVETVTRESRVGRHRADLRFEAHEAVGRAKAVLLETKVNDALSESQVRAYCREQAEVIIYAPGLTGLLHEGNGPVDRERWVTGRQVTRALAGLEFPDLNRSYLEEVAAQADRMDAARRAARGDDDFNRVDDKSDVSADDVEAVAWVAEVAATMRARRAVDVRARNNPYDYGIFWAGSWRPIISDTGVHFDDLGVYIDIIAAHGGWEHAIALKVGGGESDSRQAVFDAAMQEGPPWHGWRRGRRSSARTFRLWSLEAGEMSASEAADGAIRASDYLGALVQAARAI
jgi:hypothetical protein